MANFSKRTRVATLIMLVFLFLLGFTSCIEKGSSLLRKGSAPLVSTRAFFEEGSPQYFLQERNNSLPEAFEEEVLAFSDADEVWVSDGGGVVFSLMSIDIETVFADVSAKLEANDWIFVESGHEYSASFIKEKGLYTWAFITCINYGDETALMVQVS